MKWNYYAISSSYAATASYALNASSANTGSLLLTASAYQNVITFTKGNGSVFSVTVATGSSSSTSSTFPYTGSAQITGSLGITGSLTVTGGITGSFSGSGIISSASYALTSSNILGGTAGYVPLWSTNTSLGNSVIFQSSSNIGIGNSPQNSFRLDVNGQSVLRGAVYTSGSLIDFGTSEWTFNNNNFSYLGRTYNVTVGATSSLSAKLGVRGTGTTSATTAFRVENSSTVPSLTVLDNGFVGIRRSNPTVALDVSGSAIISGSVTVWSSSGISFFDSSGYGGGRINGGYGYLLGEVYIRPLGAGGDFLFSPNSGMSIGGFSIGGTAGSPPAYGLAVSGSVGIGTRVPSASLHISGTAVASLFRIDSPTVSSIIFVSGSGVVGFNQTSSLTSQATFKGVLGSLNLTEINTTANGGYGLRTDGPIKGDGYYFYNAGGGNILTAGGISMMSFDSSRNVGIAISSSIGARLHVRGAGTTSATTTFRVDNANASASLTITDDLTSRFFGNVGIGALPASGSLHVSASASTSSAAVYIYKSGSTTLDIQGSQGQLFSVTDVLSGSLMSVNDISGLPILEVFSDDRIVMGAFGAPGLIVSASRVFATGSFSGSFTGSLFGTSSWANNAITASLARTASYINPLTQSVFIFGSTQITGSTAIKGDFNVSSATTIDFNTSVLNINAPTITVPTFATPYSPSVNTRVVMYDAVSNALFVTSSVSLISSPTSFIATGSITASVNTDINNLFLVKSGSVDLLKINSEKVLITFTQSATPIPIAGGIFISSSGDLFFGV
jgi:hypothetical protein